MDSDFIYPIPREGSLYEANELQAKEGIKKKEIHEQKKLLAIA